jgi:hypothetical protein
LRARLADFAMRSGIGKKHARQGDMFM